jgi:hypothetical protein
MASLLDYIESRAISAQDPSFASLIFAAIRKGDTENVGRIGLAFPDLYKEFCLRYDAPGGAINAEEEKWAEENLTA